VGAPSWAAEGEGEPLHSGVEVVKLTDQGHLELAPVPGHRSIADT
jgi:hypothetical protein